MSLYEINQSLMSQMPPYTDAQIKKLIEQIIDWDISKNYRVKYYMLLNNEKHYYTIIHYDNSSVPHVDFEDLGTSAITLLQEMGYSIVADELTDDHYEIWVKDDKETLCYLLFPYD